ncbi:MAG: S-layer homology domain-containing protein [Clostridiaceae bacterium]|nr:S-layer homology domain-containing protein [Clostridiaceae bacterium]
MKKRLLIKLGTLMLTVFICVQSIYAAPEVKLVQQRAEALVSLGILKGYEDGSLKLENKIKRSEFITLVVKLNGYDKDTLLDDIKVSFKDISSKHWAYNNIKLSIKHNLVTGYPDNTIAPDKNVTYAEALAVIIKALGYESTLKGKWPKNVIDKATELKINKDIDLSDNHQLTRGEMSMIVYNALTVNFNKE